MYLVGAQLPVGPTLKMLNCTDCKLTEILKILSPKTPPLGFKVGVPWVDEGKSVGHGCWPGRLCWGSKSGWC